MRRQQHGFTLLEVLIAISILGTAILSVFTIYTHCSLELQRARNRTIATQCAQQMIEFICSTPHDVTVYHGLQTTAVLAANHPARADLLAWQATLQHVLPDAVGTVTVGDDPDLPYTTRITVSINYANYRRPTTTTLVLKRPRSFP